MNKPISSDDFATEMPSVSLQGMIEEAARAVPPLWPLEAAIAVNPLADYEGMPFGEALRITGTALPLTTWRKLVEVGRISRKHLREEAVLALGGYERAFSPVGPDLSPLDLLLARLLDVAAPAPGVRRSSRADELVAKWCAAFFSPASGNMMGDRSAGLYRTVLPFLELDPDFLRISRDAKGLCKRSVEDPHQAIDDNLQALGVGPSETALFLKQLIARLPGWAGHVRWRSEHAEGELAAPAPVTMADYLALWTLVARANPEELMPRDPRQDGDTRELLALHHGLAGKIEKLTAFGREAFESICAMCDAELGLLFLKAAERSYRESLMDNLSAVPPRDERQKTAAQLVFCIDVRSEPIRRAIEARGPYTTVGYAGFFGVAMALQPMDGSAPHRQLPVLLKPSYSLDEVAAPGKEQEAALASRRNGLFRTARCAFNASKLGLATSFATAEAGGLPAATAMLARTLAPVSAESGACKLGRGTDHHAVAPASAESGMTIAERVDCARSFFALTGLAPENSPRLVAFVGHGGSATNNPFAAALDCGACGGHRGGANARVLADILNSRAVREDLAKLGMHVPADTHFVAAEHDTTTDVITFFDVHTIPMTHRAELGTLMNDLAAAGSATRTERASRLGCKPGDVHVRAAHWGEVRPEWGLAGNAAFIIGPRSMTEHVDLEGRAFLHSYDWQRDRTGEALETILTAPMIVAQWINCQYLFSTLDNDRFGAGDKITHNVVGGIGAVQGNSNDLLVGLPRQSLFDDAGLPFHLPQRLLTIVQAPLARLEEIIGRNENLQNLFDHEWVQLIAMDPIRGSKLRWRPRVPPEAMKMSEPTARDIALVA